MDKISANSNFTGTYQGERKEGHEPSMDPVMDAFIRIDTALRELIALGGNDRTLSYIENVTESIRDGSFQDEE